MAISHTVVLILSSAILTRPVAAFVGGSPRVLLRRRHSSQQHDCKNEWLLASASSSSDREGNGSNGSRNPTNGLLDGNTHAAPSSRKRQKTASKLISPRNIASGARYQRAEMMEHAILTRQEEFRYGRQVVRARELRMAIDELISDRRGSSSVRQESEDEDDEEEEDESQEELDRDFLSYQLEYLSLYGFRPSIQDFHDNDTGRANKAATITLGGFDLEDDLLINHAQHRSHHLLQLRNNYYQQPPSSHSSSEPTSMPLPPPPPPATSNKRNGYRNDSSYIYHSSSSSTSNNNNNSYTPLLHIPLNELSESDVVTTLSIPGGRSELVSILLEGAYAREILMRRNVKLVTSIAKQWMRNSFSTANANGSSSSSDSSSSNNNRSTNKKYLSQIYEGSWDRPSLDEAVQEGMLGLARAVDKYDPERGLRFSTYATHWITSYVRVCFQRAVTGCLRVPSQLHDIKAAYQKIIKEHLVCGEEPPEQTVIAKALGISPQRLSTAIRATGSLVSVDAPVISPGSGSYKGSAAGGDGSNSQELLILDTLKCAEPKPEDQVEVSFLRQCLENAMASELTPYERDVLRLRLGLDSGTGKTVREIVEICGGGVTMSDVRAAERRAFKKLRSPTSVHTHNLLAYLDLAGADITFR